MQLHFPKIRPRYWLAVAAIVLLAMLAYAYIAMTRQRGAVGYATAPLRDGDITQTVSANGTLNPVTVVLVGSQVSGTVQKLYVDYNSQVRRGQVLAQLDQTLFKAQVAQDTANLHSAEATLALDRLTEDREAKLRKINYVSQADLDQAVANVRTAQAQAEAVAALLDHDRTNLAYTVIHSPVDGIVINRNVDVGQTVAASFQTPTLFSIGQNLRNMQIDVTVDEADVGLIEVGQRVDFTVDAYPERPFTGKVRQVRLNAAVQQNVVTYDVVVSVDNADGKLLPSMTAYANIVVAQRRHVLLAPNAALRVRIPGIATPSAAAAGGGVVYVLQDGKLRSVPVKTGASDAQQTEIVAGAVRTGDRLVTGFGAATTAPAHRPFQLF